MTSYAFSEAAMMRGIEEFKAEQRALEQKVAQEREQAALEKGNAQAAAAQEQEQWGRLHAAKIRTIVEIVARACDVPSSEVWMRRRKVEIVRPRQLAMMLVYQQGFYSLPQIGRIFGGYHHTTVLHAIQISKQRCATAPFWIAVLKEIQQTLGGEPCKKAPCSSHSHSSQSSLAQFPPSRPRTIAATAR